MSKRPYLDTHQNPHKFTRCFPEQINDAECVWHRDHYDRTVKVLSGSGWKFQHDNQVPVELSEGDHFQIRAGEFHRVIKGTGQLILEITEHTSDTTGWTDDYDS
jgi:quercetin dioxygenase-like cupin family protein